MDIATILNGVGLAITTIQRVKAQIEETKGTLSSEDKERVAGALKALRDENDGLYESVDAKLAAASQQKAKGS